MAAAGFFRLASLGAVRVCDVKHPIFRIIYLVQWILQCFILWDEQRPTDGLALRWNA
jgi:hypothetical protein